MGTSDTLIIAKSGAGSKTAVCAFNFFDTALQSPLSENGGFCRTVLLFLQKIGIVQHKESKFKKIFCICQKNISIFRENSRPSS